MKTRIITAAVALVLFAVIIFFLPVWALAAAFAIICAVAARELQPGSLTKQGVLVGVTMLCGVLMPVFTVYLPFFVMPMAFVFMVFLFVYNILQKRHSLAHVTRALFAGIVVPFFLCSLIRLYMMDEKHGALLLLMPCVCAWLCDTFAYFTGLLIGHHKLAPELSPKKTVEGSIGGLVGAVVGMLIYGLILKKAGLGPNFPLLAVSGLLGGVLAQIGDLSMSMIKRERNIKDFGSVFPGHGGVMDRFDSILFTAPFFEIMITFTYILKI